MIAINSTTTMTSNPITTSPKISCQRESRGHSRINAHSGRRGGAQHGGLLRASPGLDLSAAPGALGMTRYCGRRFSHNAVARTSASGNGGESLPIWNEHHGTVVAPGIGHVAVGMHRQGYDLRIAGPLIALIVVDSPEAAAVTQHTVDEQSPYQVAESLVGQ